VTKATVRNQGNKTARVGLFNDIDVGLFVGTTKIAEPTFDDLPPGAAVTVSSGNKTAPAAGNYTVKAVADLNYDVAESNENNNEKSSPWMVQFGRITSAYWLAPLEVVEGTVATMRAQVEGFSVGDQFTFEIYEDDGFLGSQYVTTVYGNVYSSGGNYYADATWTTEWQEDQFGDPEFYFKVRHGATSLESSRDAAQELKVHQGATLSVSLANDISGYVPQNVRFVLNTTPARQTNGNPAAYTKLPAGTFQVDAFQTGNWWGEEFWARQSVTLTAGQTTTATLLRRYPYASSLLISNVTIGGLVAQGQTISSGTQLRAFVTVKNASAAALNAKVRLVVDPDRTGPYNHDQTSATLSVPTGTAGRVFTFDFAPTALGRYFVAIEVQTSVDSTFRRTDSWDWPSVASFTDTNVVQPIIRIVPERLSLTATLSASGAPPVTSAETTSAPEATATTKGRKILLKTGTIETEHQDAETLAASRFIPTRARSHVLIQFNQIPSVKEREELAASGVKLLRYVPHNAYWASVPLTARSTLAGLRSGGGVRWLRDSSAIDKLSPRAARNQFPPNARLDDGRVLVMVVIFKGEAQTDAAADFESVGGQVMNWETDTLGRMAISPLSLRNLAALDCVEWVEPAPPPNTTGNATAAQRIQADQLRLAPYNLDGAGVTVGVWDAGEVDAHTDFGTRLTVIDRGGTVRDRRHATHVAGTISGSGAGNAAARGMAPGVALRTYDWSGDTGEMRDAVRDNVRLSNHSYDFITGWYWDDDQQNWIDYGANGFGDYGPHASAWDDVVYDTGLIVFKAAGNDRADDPPGPGIDGPYDTIGPLASAKNIITIGATTDADAMTRFSSWGPTDDGRVKPDLCANGTTVLSTITNNGYDVMQGTSMATPSACGTAAMLHQFHAQLVGKDMRPDTCKAILIHGATDLPPTGPDYQSGWGLINAVASAEILRKGQYLQAAVGHGETRTHEAQVPSGATSVKVTIVWTDPAGSAGADPALVNNLDLVIMSPSGQKHRPWVLDPAALLMRLQRVSMKWITSNRSLHRLKPGNGRSRFAERLFRRTPRRNTLLFANT